MAIKDRTLETAFEGSSPPGSGRMIDLLMFSASSFMSKLLSLPQWRVLQPAHPAQTGGSTLPLTFEPLGTTLWEMGCAHWIRPITACSWGWEQGQPQGQLGREVEKDQGNGCLPASHRCPRHSAVIFSQMGGIMTLFPQFC